MIFTITSNMYPTTRRKNCCNFKAEKTGPQSQAITKANPPLGFIHLNKETRHCNCLDVTFLGVFLVSSIQWGKTATLIFSFGDSLAVCGVSNLEEWYHGGNQGRALSASSLLEEGDRAAALAAEPSQEYRALLSSTPRFKENSMTCCFEMQQKPWFLRDIPVTHSQFVLSARI